MQRSLCRSRAQLVLENHNRQAPAERSKEGLIEALADLLLEALRAEESAMTAAISSKVTSEHLGHIAVVNVCQSTMAQVTGNLESQRRQYDVVGAAEKAGFASVTVIGDDLGRSGSGNVQRPGFERLVAMLCSGDVGAVYCIEASRLARNGRDWHHLIELCALAGAVVIDPDGAYDPRLVNDPLLLGLKGTMSEYELSFLRQRGIAAHSKAWRGECRFMLPRGFCWSEVGRSKSTQTNIWSPRVFVREAVGARPFSVAIAGGRSCHDQRYERSHCGAAGNRTAEADAGQGTARAVRAI